MTDLRVGDRVEWAEGIDIGLSRGTVELGRNGRPRVRWDTYIPGGTASVMTPRATTGDHPARLQ